MRIQLVVAAAAVIVVGCATATSSPSGQSTSSSPAPPLATQEPASPGPTPGASAVTSSPVVSVDSAVTVNADLALRPKPDAGAEAAGTVAAGTNAWVAGAMRDGGGWYQLVPLDPASDWASGWISEAEGSAALTPIDLGCDSIGLSASLLASLSPGSKLACYSEPFSFAARIVDCNCDIDGGYVEPGWLGNSSVNGPDGQETALLIDEDQVAPPSDPGEWLMLHLAPDAIAPDQLPFGEVVQISGEFDHPSAALCVVPDGVEIAPDDPVLYCRTNLAVTAIGG